MDYGYSICSYYDKQLYLYVLLIKNQYNLNLKKISAMLPYTTEDPRKP